MTSDPHAPYVNQLSEVGDWAALVRYWIAHQHEPAMEVAIGCVRRRVLAQESHLQPLVAYLEAAQVQPVAQAPEAIMTGLRTGERLTLLLLNLCQEAFVCEMAARIPPERRKQLVQMGVEAAQRATQAAVAVEDPALVAFLFGLQARGHFELHQLEAALEAWQTALELYRKLDRERPDVYLPYVALTLYNLGNLRAGLNDLESARASFGEALAVFRELAGTAPGSFQPHIAKTLNGLGTVLRELGDLEPAKASFDDALELYRELAQASPQDFRADVAMTLTNLGSVQRELKELEAALVNLKEALAIQRELAGLEPQLFQPPLAVTLDNLGSVQGELDELEAARASFQESLGIRRDLARTQPGGFSAELAMTLNNLGVILRDLNELEAARVSLEEAAKIWRDLARAKPRFFRADLAMTLNNLGIVLRDLSQLEAAQSIYKEAVAIYRELAQARPEVFQQREAMTLNNLGTVQRDLNDLESARTSFEQALAIRRRLVRARPEVFALSLAMTLNNLGDVQRDLNELKAARTSLDDALAIWRKLAQTRTEDYRRHEAMTLNNLGAVQARLNELPSARASFEAALAIRRALAQARPEVYRTDVAQTLTNLGNVQRGLEDLEAARSSFEAAARLYTENAATHPTARLAERQGCWVKLGALLRQESSRLGWPDYRLAREALRQGQRAAEQFRRCFADPVQRKRVQAESAEVYDLLARTCLDLWDASCGEGQPDMDNLREAVETAETGRARQILDLLADEILTPSLPPEEHPLATAWPQIRRQFLQAGRWLRQEEEREAHGGDGMMASERGGLGTEGEQRQLVRRGTPESFSHSEFRGPASAGNTSAPPPAAPTAVARAREVFARRQREHDQALAAIRRFHSEFDPDRPVARVKLEELQKQVPTDVPTGLVQFTVDREGGFALIVTREQVLAVRLPEVTEAWAQAHAKAWFKSYDARSKIASAGAETAKPRDNWGEAVERLLEPLGARVMRPVVRGLADLGLKRLVLAPHRALHVFPLHACNIGEGCYLGDMFEILYTPSLSMWHRCARLQREAPQEVLVIQNPTLDDALRFTDMEGAGAARRFQPHVRTYRGLAAQKEVLLEQGQSSQVWHYCGHARFYAAEPLRSALILGGMDAAVHGEKWLTLRDVFTRLHLPHNSLSILNGCETGMLMPEAADDYVNLPTGFLYAGARCVISTLWSVNDLSSALVMDKFYALWRGENGAKPLAPSAALREAVRWLREDIRSGGQVARDLVPPLLAGLPDPATRTACEAAARELERRYPDRPPFASPAHWAPFICSGVGYR